MANGTMFLVYGALAFKALWYTGVFCAIVWLMRHLNSRIRLKEDELALEKQRTVQIDEALALLRSINENLAHRTSKN